MGVTKEGLMLPNTVNTWCETVHLARCTYRSS